MTTDQPIMATVEVRLERTDKQTKTDVQERLYRESLGVVGPSNSHWEGGDTFVSTWEIPIATYAKLCMGNVRISP